MADFCVPVVGIGRGPKWMSGGDRQTETWGWQVTGGKGQADSGTGGS